LLEASKLGVACAKEIYPGSVKNILRQFFIEFKVDLILNGFLIHQIKNKLAIIA